MTLREDADPGFPEVDETKLKGDLLPFLGLISWIIGAILVSMFAAMLVKTYVSHNTAIT